LPIRASITLVQEKVFDIGPIHATAEKHERIPLPPVIGGLALIGGVVLLVVGASKRHSGDYGLKRFERSLYEM